ncbi:hypothetical protein Acr_01g0005910 [Actinidia rufa]|uniref:Uncharacterized protein n=1 Tax=Actinidia rufa TaxID=165716 RepID=A0A7J0E3F3_9ERIC|nr:hypothetical protein Acr_01g0005910 [Actinidia rufa]
MCLLGGKMAHNRELQSLKVFQVENLKEHVDQEKTETKETEVRPNPRFNRGDDETNNTLEEDLIRTIHMIGAQITPTLRICSREISASSNKWTRFSQSIPMVRMPRQGLSEPGSVTFTKADLKQIHYNNPLVIDADPWLQCQTDLGGLEQFS